MKMEQGSDNCYAVLNEKNLVCDANSGLINLGGGYLTSSPVMTSNWKADSGQRWTVPLGGDVGKLFKVGKLPLNTQLQAFGNVERPKFASDWSLRFQIQFLFPK